MLLDLMFIQKEGNNNIKKFKNCFSKIIKFEKQELYLEGIKFNYIIQKSEAGKGIRLKVVSAEGRSTKKEADKISNLKNAMIKGAHRSEYHIVLIFDGPSEYYCNKLMRMMSVFERKLRQFIYLNVLNVYGKDWVKETVSKDIQSQVNKNEHNKNRHIEKALECFTFQLYIDYLFTKRAIQNEVEVIKEAKSALLSRNNYSIREIIEILNRGEQLSLWERLFKGLDIDFNENEINKIRFIRNIIMHNKEVSDIEFTEYKRLLSRSIKKLDEGISIVEVEKYSTPERDMDILNSLGETISIMREVGESVFETISPALHEISRIIQIITEDINTSEFVKTIQKNIVNNFQANIATMDGVVLSRDIIDFGNQNDDSYQQLHSTINNVICDNKILEEKEINEEN